MTEGPFYLDLDLLRTDVTEGKPGTPLDLTLTVLDTQCAPISNAAVDIWHTDAAGDYSGVQGSTGTTFMRGTQISGADGVVRFHTVYPGWYTGRTVHIHVKVHVANHEVHTGQLFFDDDQTDTAYRVSPYSSRDARDTRNADDSIFADGGKSSTLALTQSGSGYASAMNLGVRT
jgi:protocatechuate 3,4-dioxygenase beta subunit